MFNYNAITLMIFFFCYSAFAQINTESFRSTFLNDTLQTKISLGIGMNKGNQDFLKVALGSRVDWKFDDFYSFIAINGDYVKGQSVLITNKGFVHTRISKNMNESLFAELFLQKEYNDFTLLKDRNVGGLGIRWHIIGDEYNRNNYPLIFFGSSVMYEMEKLNEKTGIDITKLIKSSNYLSLTWKLAESTYLKTVTYFQIATNNALDRRILNNSFFEFIINSNLKFTFNFNYRYDHQPPSGLGNYDMEITNNFNIVF